MSTCAKRIFRNHHNSLDVDFTSHFVVLANTDKSLNYGCDVNVHVCLFQDCVSNLMVDVLGPGRIKSIYFWVSGKTKNGSQSTDEDIGTFMCGKRCRENDSPLPGMLRCTRLNQNFIKDSVILKLLQLHLQAQFPLAQFL